MFIEILEVIAADQDLIITKGETYSGEIIKDILIASMVTGLFVYINGGATRIPVTGKIAVRALTDGKQHFFTAEFNNAKLN